MTLTSSEPRAQTRYLTAFIISVCLFLIYNLNLRSIDSVDTLPNTLLPVSILKYGDLNLNEFENLFEPQPDVWQAAFGFGALQRNEREIISSYPPGAAILAAPFYGAARMLGILQPREWNSYRLAGKLAASIFVALSVGILFLCLSLITTMSTSIWLTLAYGLGTGAFSTASQALWQHGPGMFCLSVALWAVCQLEYGQRSSHSLAVVASAALAMAVVCRNLNIVAALTITAYMLVYHRRLLWSFAIPAAIFAAGLVAYNYHTYGTVSGGYEAILNSDWHKSRQLQVGNLFSHPLLQGYLDTWLSPSKGFFIYSPFLVFALVFPFLGKSPDRFRLGGFLFLWLVVISAVLAKNVLWWGGTSFGPRYFLETGIAAVFIIGLVYEHLPGVFRLVLKLLIVVSISIHTLGAFFAPCGWAESPNWADFHTERYWDWTDTEIARCAVQGWRHGPLPAEFR